jgi:hypothetical protein
MDTQFKSYQTTLIEEAEQIERAFVEERTELITTNSKEVDRLFETRRNNEAYRISNCLILVAIIWTREQNGLKTTSLNWSN